ncbi:hypothetical protein [Gimesia panareensis]|uniref:hypothetical protein n=1 Tax=Gimesia panareensis TaxID=2527978 RepID=UPI0011A1F4EC|nr:hypothetical protein [Gimesia panareensis]
MTRVLHFALFYFATIVASCNGFTEGQKQAENLLELQIPVLQALTEKNDEKILSGTAYAIYPKQRWWQALARTCSIQHRKGASFTYVFGAPFFIPPHFPLELSIQSSRLLEFLT